MRPVAIRAEADVGDHPGSHVFVTASVVDAGVGVSQRLCVMSGHAFCWCLRYKSALFAAAVLLVCGAAHCRKIVTTSTVPSYTVSPDGHTGVSIPHWDFDRSEVQQDSNTIIDMATSRTLATIRQWWPAYDRSLNHHSMAQPTWSDDSSILLWYVDGKWSPDSVNLVCMDRGRVSWQMDLQREGTRALLERTREASPSQYRKVKRNSGASRNDPVYPDGFSVDVEVLEPLLFPVHFVAALTANPKDVPSEPDLKAHLEGTVDAKGKLCVKHFELGGGPSPHFGDDEDDDTSLGCRMIYRR